MNVVGYNAALSACARAGDWQRANALLVELQSKALNNSTTKSMADHVSYGTVLSACVNAEQWDLVLDHARAMEQDDSLLESLDTLALTSVLKACQQLGLAKEALHYLDIMKTKTMNPIDNNNNNQYNDSNNQHPYTRKTSGWKRKGVKQPLQGPDAVAYRLAISACARGGAWKEGIQLLQDFQNVTGEAPDVVAYTAAITGCEYAGEWRRAFTLLDTMRKNEIQPNHVTMAAVIGACATACAKQTSAGGGSSDIAFRETGTSPMPLPQHKALQLLNVMKKDESVVDPNINVYNAAIRACAEACDLKRALSLMKDLQAQGLEPTIVTFGTLMTASERVESIEGANAVFRAMKEHGMEPNEIIYGAAISCCRKAGQAERAFLLLRKMVREGLSPNVATFNTAIMAQAESKVAHSECMDRAISIYKIMISKSLQVGRPNRQTYNLLIRALAGEKRANEAETLLRRMGEAGYVPDVDLYAATVTAYERTGQPLKALRLMESMREDGYDFYGVEVLNTAFKNAVKLVNVVGRGLTSKDDGKDSPWINLADDDEEDADDKNVEALIGGDFAGYMGTFSPRDGSLIPIPTYLVPSTLLEWGQEPSSLEIIVSEEERNSSDEDECVLLKRHTITALPAIGCGVDNLETTKSQQVFAANTTSAFVGTSARTLDVVKGGQDDTVVELETIFGLAQVEGEAHRLRVSTTIQRMEQDSRVCMIQSPIRVHLERQSSPISSRGTVADGGGLDGRTVSTRIGTALKQYINFADRPPLAKGRIWTTSSSSDKEDDTTFSATRPTIVPLPGNVEIVSGPSKDNQQWIIQVCHFTPNPPKDSDENNELLVGVRRVIQRSFPTKRSGASTTSSSTEWTTTFFEQEGGYSSSSTSGSNAAS